MSISSQPHFAFLDNGELPLAFAHQGAGDAVGMDNRNTMRAFEAAIQQGYQYLETDVVCSADGKLVVTHGSSGPDEAAASGLPLRSVLESMSLSEIQATYLFNGQPMPELEEVFRTYPEVRVNIDSKTERAAAALPILIRRTGTIDRVCIASFDYRNTLSVAKALGGQNRVCTSTGRLGGYALLVGGQIGSSYLSRTKAACLQLPHEMSIPHTGGRLKVQITAGMIDLAAEHGKQVHVWTPNKRHEMERALVAGVHGVMSDETQTLKSLLVERGDWF